MSKVIKSYSAKHGEVTVTEYITSTHYEYHVFYSYWGHLFSAWFDNKKDAIVHAQFIAGKY